MIERLSAPELYILPTLSSTIGHWRFRDNLADISGDDHTLSSSGALTYSTGKSESGNTSVKFGSGAIASLTVASSTNFDMGIEDFTIETIVRIPSGGSVSESLDKHTDGGGGVYTGWRTTYAGSNKFSLQGGDGNAPTVFSCDTDALTDDTWHYVAWTVDRGNSSIIPYIDGVAGTTTTIHASLGNIDNSGVAFIVRAGPTDMLFDEVCITKSALTPAQILQRATVHTPSSFMTEDNIKPYLYKYPTPVTSIEYGDSVYNVMSKGIDTYWKAENSSNVLSTSFTGRTPIVKFYYHNGVPPAVLDYINGKRWGISHRMYFNPPITADYTFYFAGEGEVDVDLNGTDSTSLSLGINDSDYTEFGPFSLTKDNKVYLLTDYVTHRNYEDASMLIMWKTDSAYVTPEKIPLSAGVCCPYTDNADLSYSSVSFYSKLNYKESKDGASQFSFELPFVSSANYGGYYYNSSSDSYIDSDSSLEIKKYRTIRYKEGYRNKNNEDELATRFVGQIRDFKIKYDKKGKDTLQIICYDFSSFTKDTINLVSPTPIDYWQVGYIEDVPGRYDGEDKPRAFDGWNIDDAYKVLLTESLIDPYTFYQRKSKLDYDGKSVDGSFEIEPINSSVQSHLSVKTKYGLKSIGEVDDPEMDDEYSYKVGTGEYYKDFIDKICKSIYYNWGFNPEGKPYLKRVNVPNSYVNSTEFSTSGYASKQINFKSFKGNYLKIGDISDQISNPQFNYTEMGDIWLDGVSRGNAVVTYYRSDMNENYGPNTYSRSLATVLSNDSLSSSAALYLTYLCGYEEDPPVQYEVYIYGTSDATTDFPIWDTITTTTWRQLGYSTFYPMRVPSGGENYSWETIHKREIIPNDYEDFKNIRSVGINCYMKRLTNDNHYGWFIFGGIRYNTADASLITDSSYAICSATGKKFELMLGVGPECGSSDGVTPSCNITLKKGENILVDTNMNLYASTSHFYFDGANKTTGINQSKIRLANGLPYDSYDIKIVNLSTSWHTRIEGLLAFDEDYEVPVQTYYTGDSTASGNISTLGTKINIKDHRTDCLVLGARTGTQVKLKDGKEQQYNPNNPTSVYVQSYSRDLNSVYKSTASNYVGRPRMTVIQDPSIISQSQADFVSFNVVSEYNVPKKEVSFSIQGHPLIQIGDCIAVVDEYKSGVTEDDYVWVEGFTNTFDKTFMTNVQTSPVKPVDSFWRKPKLDIKNDFNNVYIRNLKITNKGYKEKLYFSFLFSDTSEMCIRKTSEYISGCIPNQGYLKIGEEIMKYTSVDATHANYLRVANITRNLGTESTPGAAAGNRGYDSYSDVVFGYNPYSLSAIPPTVEFDLLADAQVEIAVLNYVDQGSNNLKKNINEFEIDYLTNIEDGDLISNTYEFMNVGNYIRLWGGFDRIGEYNNSVKGDDEGLNFINTNYYARENYKFFYAMDGWGGGTEENGYGDFYTRISIKPADKPDVTYVYKSVDVGSHLNNKREKIKQILPYPGTVDLKFTTASGSFYYCSTESVLKGIGNRDVTFKVNEPSINISNISGSNDLSDISIVATNYPMTYSTTTFESGTISTSLPSYLLNKSNNNKGLSFKILDYSADKGRDSSFKRTFIPSMSCKFIQMAAFFIDGHGWRYRTNTISFDLTDKIDIIEPGKEYYINFKALLAEKQNNFTNPEWIDEFKTNSTDGDGSVYYVTNYILFDNNMIDMSGRRPKQYMYYKQNKKPEPEEYLPSLRDYQITHYRHLYWDYYDAGEAPIEMINYSYTNNNRGFYEFTNAGISKMWYLGYANFNSDGQITSVPGFEWHFNENLRSEICIHDYKRVTSGLYVPPFLRSNFTTWLDEDYVKRLVWWWPDPVIGSRPNHPVRLIESAPEFYNHYIPRIWAYFYKEDL